MKPPSLSILIPSYNGEEHIGKLLSSLELQVIKTNELGLEIILGINGSTDNTANLASKFHKSLKYLKTIEFDDNLGYDRNLLRILSYAQGDFVWFIGDDDLVLTEGLNVIQQILSSNKEDPGLKCVIIEPEYFFQDSMIEKYPVNNPIIEYYDNTENYVSRIKWNGAALSSLLIQRPSIDTIHNCESLIGTNWIHLGLLYNQICDANKAKYCFVTKGILAVRTGNPRWEQNYGNFLYVGLVHLNMLCTLLGPRYPRLQKMFRDLRKKGNWEDVNRGILDLNWREKREIVNLEIKFMWRYPIFWLVTFPILMAPMRFHRKMIAIEEKVYISWKKSRLLRVFHNKDKIQT